MPGWSRPRSPTRRRNDWGSDSLAPDALGHGGKEGLVGRGEAAAGQHLGRAAVVLLDVADPLESDPAQQGERGRVLRGHGGVHLGLPERVEGMGDDRLRHLGPQAGTPGCGSQGVDDLVASDGVGPLDFGVPDQQPAPTGGPDVEQVLGVDLAEDPPEQGPVGRLGSRALTHPPGHPRVLEESDEALFVLLGVRVQEQAGRAQGRSHEWRRHAARSEAANHFHRGGIRSGCT